jgi:hypothetical protein
VDRARGQPLGVGFRPRRPNPIAPPQRRPY